MTWHDLSWLDLSITFVVGMSVLVGLLTGLLREIISIGSLSLSVAATAFYYERAAAFIERWVDRVDVVSIVSFFSILIVSWAFAGTIGLVLTSLLPKGRIDLRSRFFGGLFGLIKGVSLAVIVLMVLTVYLPHGTVAFRESRLYPPTVQGSRLFAGILPLEERLILLRRLERRPEPGAPAPAAADGYV